jgi:hypothetical protein
MWNREPAMPMSSPLDSFVPDPDAAGRFAVMVRAPSDLVYRSACEFDMQSPWLVRTILGLRGWWFGSTARPSPARGLAAETRALGWGCLAERQGELFVAGSVCRPWQADVVFSPVPADQFLTFSKSDYVKIAWTLEVEIISSSKSRLASETRWSRWIARRAADFSAIGGGPDSASFRSAG